MTRLDEVKKLQKIAGILKENISEAPGEGSSIDATVMASFPGAKKAAIRPEDTETSEDFGDTIEAYYRLIDGEEVFGEVFVITTDEGKLMYRHFDANGDLLAYDGGLQGQDEPYTGTIVNGKLAPIDHKVTFPEEEVEILDMIKSKFPQFPIDDYEVFKWEYEIPKGEFDSEIGLDNIRALNSAADRGYIELRGDMVYINSMFYSKEQQEKARAKYK